MLDDSAVLRTGYLRLLLWPNHRLIRARCTVYCPCEEIPREPFEPFAVHRFQWIWYITKSQVKEVRKCVKIFV